MSRIYMTRTGAKLWNFSRLVLAECGRGLGVSAFALVLGAATGAVIMAVLWLLGSLVTSGPTSERLGLGGVLAWGVVLTVFALGVVFKLIRRLRALWRMS